MNENHALILLNFIDANWALFEFECAEKKEDPEWIRSELEKIAMGETNGNH